MVKYRVKTYVADGRLVTELLNEGVEDFTGRKIELRDVILEPKLIWWVYNLQCTLAAEIELAKSASRIVCYRNELPEQIYRAALRDIEDAGGGINLSGQYPLSAESMDLVRKMIGEKVRAWLTSELRELGLEIVE